MLTSKITPLQSKARLKRHVLSLKVSRWDVGPELLHPWPQWHAVHSAPLAVSIFGVALFCWGTLPPALDHGHCSTSCRTATATSTSPALQTRPDQPEQDPVVSSTLGEPSFVSVSSCLAIFCFRYSFIDRPHSLWLCPFFHQSLPYPNTDPFYQPPFTQYSQSPRP
jgi:hypothetical protein